MSDTKPKIHPTAIVEPGAELGAGVEIGPCCTVAANAKLGAGTRLIGHVVVEGPCEIGERNLFHPFSRIAGPPQDLKYAGEPTWLRMGDENVVRECVTLNRGTAHGHGESVIGNRCLFMAYSHVAHDCIVGDNVIVANSAALAGHITIESNVILAGLVAVHQFVRVGEGALVSGGAMLVQDCPPFAVVQGDRARMISVNTIGMRRRGVAEEDIKAATRALKALMRSRQPMAETLAAIREAGGGNRYVEQIITFCEASERGLAP